MQHLITLIIRLESPVNAYRKGQLSGWANWLILDLAHQTHMTSLRQLSGSIAVITL